MEKPVNISKLDWEILKEKYKNNENYLETKLNEHYPIQYLIGNVNFYGLTIKVDERVFIPRFETEQLVEKTINCINKLDIKSPKILDICSGSGCIAIALAKFIENSSVDAIEINPKSIEIAKENAKNNEVKVNFINCDINSLDKLETYDVIISNPPYVAEGEKIDEENKFEPQIALFASNDGLKFYESIAKKISKTSKIIAFEIGKNQGSSVKNLLGKYFPGNKITVEQDFCGKDRFVFCIKILHKK